MGSPFKRSKYRSINWRLHLGIVPKLFTEEDYVEAFDKVTKQHRTEYRRRLISHASVIACDHVPQPQTEEEVAEQKRASESSRFGAYMANDDSLLIQLRKDITRTFSDIDYFQQEETQQMLERILFIWTKEYETQAVYYQQGMHEILAVIVMALLKDIQLVEAERGIKVDSQLPDRVTQESLAIDDDPSDSARAATRWQHLLERKHLEHDAWTTFKTLLNTLLPCYSGGAFIPGKIDTLQPFLYCKVHRVHFELLSRFDPELFAHLEAANVLPQLYLIRWIRLVFTREFTIEQSFLIWDKVLQSKGMELADYLCVAMLVHIRQTLLVMNTSHCLAKIFHYPALGEAQVRELLDTAEGLFQGKKFNFSEQHTVMPELTATLKGVQATMAASMGNMWERAKSAVNSTTHSIKVMRDPGRRPVGPQHVQGEELGAL